MSDEQNDANNNELVDVTPLTLSIEGDSGRVIQVIARNTVIPVKKTISVSTARDWQTKMEIHVLQGEGPMATDNRTLEHFVIDGIPLAPRGALQIEATFDIDGNGILNVSAKDKTSNQGLRVAVTSSDGLTLDEIHELTEEARNKGWIK